MSDMLSLLTASFGVGTVVGLTGMGGGALMTPALILMGVPPTSAIANDLVAACLHKTIGAAVHWHQGSPTLALVKWLILGSMPTAFAGAFIVHTSGNLEHQQSILRLLLGSTLLITSCMYVTRIHFELHRDGILEPDAPEPVIRPLATVSLGAIGGLLVGVTSVGSGTLIMVVLLLLYPTLAPNRIVGTDLVQAVPLVLSASISQVIVRGVDWPVLLPLVLGGVPGTYYGSRIARRVPPSVTRRGIAVMLVIAGLAMLGIPPLWVGAVGVMVALVLTQEGRIMHRRSLSSQ